MSELEIKPTSLFNNLLSDCRPVATKSRCFNAADQKFIDAEGNRLHSAGIICPSVSPWRAQALVVNNKESGKKRLCVDYSQTVNLFTQLDAYSLSRIDDLVNKLPAYRVLSTFDLKSAYHQIPILESDKLYTAFEAGGKLWEFNRIPFGATNEVPQFQRKMDKIVEKDELKDTFPYLDNVTVGRMNQEEHDANVSAFVDASKRRHLNLNDSKTISSISDISILGYRVGKETIRPDSERLQSLLDLPPSNNTKSLKRMLWLFADYARWVTNYSEKIVRLKSVTSFPLSFEAVKDFESLKQDIANASLQAIDENAPFVVECDASDVAISATLNQAGGPVAFMSRTLHGSERRYPAVEKEVRAIVEAIRKWEHLLSRHHLTLITLLSTSKNVHFIPVGAN